MLLNVCCMLYVICNFLEAMALDTMNNPSINDHFSSSPGTPSPLLSPTTSEESSGSTSPNNDPDPGTANNMTRLPKAFFRKMKCYVTIEPMLLLQMIAMSSTAINVQSFYIEAICQKIYANNATTVCANLTAYTDEGQFEINNSRSYVYVTMT